MAKIMLLGFYLNVYLSGYNFYHAYFKLFYA